MCSVTCFQRNQWCTMTDLGRITWKSCTCAVHFRQSTLSKSISSPGLFNQLYFISGPRITSVKGSKSMQITWKEKYPKSFGMSALCWALVGLRCLPSRLRDRSDTYLIHDKTMCCWRERRVGRATIWRGWETLKWERNIWPGFKTMRSTCWKMGKAIDIGKYMAYSLTSSKWSCGCVRSVREKWKLRFESRIGTLCKGLIYITKCPDTVFQTTKTSIEFFVFIFDNFIEM